MDNKFLIPFINPVKFVKKGLTNSPKYYTKQFDDYLFADRILPWEQAEDYTQIWQKEDIISMQFESNFDPIIVKLLDRFGNAVFTLPAIAGLPNKFEPGTFTFEIQMSLAGIPATGCYFPEILAGSGSGIELYKGGKQFISREPFDFPNFLIEYWHDRYHEDVIFETGIHFQKRVPGHFGKLKPGTNNVATRDEYYNNTILSSRTFRQFPLYLCDEFGMPEDEIDNFNRIWTCRNVLVDGTPYGAVDGTFELQEIIGYPKLGVKMMVEPGINRRSKLFIQNTDTTQRIMSTVMVDPKIFGDTSNQGSSNAVPVNNIE